jgi:toxin ParE1/3/4
MRSYRLTPQAENDIDAVYEHVASDNVTAAGRLLYRFREAFETLAAMPGLGHLREDLTEEPLRFWSVGPYLIIYRAEQEPLEILRVIHGSRDARALLDE